MGKMKLVTDIHEVQKNIATLENERSKGGVALTWYNERIRKSLVLYPYVKDDEVRFAPSRFIGYRNNSRSNHENGHHGNGTETTSVISSILKLKPIISDGYECVFERFCNKNDISSDNRIRKFWPLNETNELLDTELLNSSDEQSETVRAQITLSRIGQGQFRSDLIMFWNHTCCVTGLNEVPLLKASHIKPWRDSSNSERLDKYNGLLLSPNADSLFDKGYISFKNNGEIIISKEINRVVILKMLGKNEGENVSIKLKKKHIKYIEHHRNNIFQK